MDDLVTESGKFLAPVQQSTISVGENKITVFSSPDGGTRLNTDELFKSGPVQDFLEAVRSKKTAAGG